MKDLDIVYAEQIANEYAPKSESKVVALKKLDQKVKTPALVFAFSMGIIGALVLGAGMCFSMEVFGKIGLPFMIMGIIIGILGILLVSINYPLYKKMLNARKQKYASDIIELASSIVDEK